MESEIKICIVSNRLPITIVKKDGKFHLECSNGGLATALKTVYENKNSIWIGWPGIITDDEEEQRIITELLRPLRLVPVFLSYKEWDGFYNGFSNNLLWPIFHYHPSYSNFDKENWLLYQQVNKKFAQIVQSHCKENDLVWLHDYQLMLVPQYLKHSFISYFHHIHFPPKEIFNIIPWRIDILKGLLECKHLVFQTQNDANNFIDTCNSYHKYLFNKDCLLENNLDYKISAHPISIDAENFKNLLEKSEVVSNYRKLSRIYSNEKVIISVDRLDYCKGLLERLKAIDSLLEENPQYIEKVTFVMIVVPSRMNVGPYENHKLLVDQWVGKINSKYSSGGWRPIQYFYQQFTPEQLVNFYALADICLITSLRDGLNLVSKEYIACRKEDTGTLILSEMAGAANELNYAIKVHPYDIDQIKDAILYALDISPEEAQLRMRDLKERVFSYTIHEWLFQIFEEVKALYPSIKINNQKSANLQILHAIKLKFTHSQKRLFLLDYDGCLRQLEKEANHALPTAEVFQVLQSLSDLPNTEVYVVSGRKHEELDEWLGHLPIHLIAEHGNAMKQKNSQWIFNETLTEDVKTLLNDLIYKYQALLKGSYCENKVGGFCFHFGNCSRELQKIYVEEFYSDLINVIDEKELPLNCYINASSIEVIPWNINKGNGLKKWVDFRSEDFILSAGDEETDEDMFRVLPKSAFTFKIGHNKSIARYRMDEIEKFIQFLHQISENCQVKH